MKTLTGKSKSLGCEEWRDTFSREFVQLSLDNLGGAQLLVLYFIRMSSNLIEDIHGKPGFCPIFMCNSVYSGNSVVLTSTREKKFGGLKEME